MRRTKTITLGEPPRDVTIREPTVAEVRNWLSDLEKLKSAPIDFITHGLIDDASLTDLVLMTDLSLEDLDILVPSEIRELLAACQELNPDFFTLRSRKMLMWQMESHAAFAALRQDQQWMVASPGSPETADTSPS
ncbi:MAG: hypothetical protein HQM01_15435 [Magnetococcales bacterium]|nr:hypothetical protein [Magnetococcales bacterium]